MVSVSKERIVVVIRSKAPYVPHRNAEAVLERPLCGLQVLRMDVDVKGLAASVPYGYLSLVIRIWVKGLFRDKDR